RVDVFFLLIAQPGVPQSIDVGMMQPEDRVERSGNRHRHQPEIAPVVWIPARRDATNGAMNHVVRQGLETAVGRLGLGPVMEDCLWPAESRWNVTVAAGKHIILER